MTRIMDPHKRVLVIRVFYVGDILPPNLINEELKDGFGAFDVHECAAVRNP
ncbi:hypothetical protein [Neobacillus drentensis]|uniref:hypothetical protein n=1 Tax=Neobacillus drentensis TaxID=220684 RepID=UPI002FFD72E8